MPTVPPAFRRALVLSAVGVATGAALTACDKPAPATTVFSGTTSANREAICWSEDAAQAFTESDCSITLQSTEDFNQRLLDKVAIIPTTPGETVGISVDPVVADNGWRVSINGRALSRDPVTENYFKFTMSPQPLRRGDAQLVIQAMTDGGDGVRGSWIFGLSSG